jgi:hypothetical protein
LNPYPFRACHKGWFVGAFLRRKRLPSVSQSAEMSFRDTLVVPLTRRVPRNRCPLPNGWFNGSPHTQLQFLSQLSRIETGNASCLQGPPKSFNNSGVPEMGNAAIVHRDRSTRPSKRAYASNCVQKTAQHRTWNDRMPRLKST